MPEESHFANSDREMLVKIDTKLERAITDIKDLNNKFDSRESSFMTKEEFMPTINDHELRLRRLEVWGATAVGILLALEFYFNYLHK